MVKFNRPEFKSGVIIVKELIVVEGKPDSFKNLRFNVKDKGKVFNFENEEYLLAKYSHMFTIVA